MDSQSAWALGAAVYGLFCGGLGSYVAEQKNRHWFEGALFGIVMGPFGVIAAACLPDRLRPAVRSEEGAAEIGIKQRYTDAEWSARAEK